MTNNDIKWMEINAPIRLEYLIRRKEIESKCASMQLWVIKDFDTNTVTELPPSRWMMRELKFLDDLYKKRLEKEDASLFD